MQTTGLNFNPTLLFDGSNFYTFPDTGLAMGSNDRSIFVVASNNDAGWWRYVLGVGTYGPPGTAGFSFGNRAGSGNIFISTHEGQLTVDSGSWYPIGSARLAFGSVSSNTLYLGNNGGPLTSGGTGLDTTADGDVNIGSNPAGIELWIGTVAEVIYYNRDLTALERQRVMSYLALKYGFSIDQTVPQSYISSGSALMWDMNAPSASTYNNDIFGIGRDDLADLSQIKSKAQSQTSIITLEAVGEGTNLAPNFQDIDDQEFLTIGSDGGAATWTTSGAPVGVSRLSRMWMKQELGGDGSVGAVTLDFDTNNSNFDVPNPVDNGAYYFLYDSNNNGSLSDELPTLMTDMGNGVWRTTVTFGAGSLFTLSSSSSPMVTMLSPIDNATNVSRTSMLALTFNRPVTAGSSMIAIRKVSDNSLVKTSMSRVHR